MAGESPLKHKPFSALRGVVAATTSVVERKPASFLTTAAAAIVERVVVREEFDSIENAVVARIIGAPPGRLDALGKQLRQALGSTVLIEGRELLVVRGDLEGIAAWLRGSLGCEVVVVQRPAAPVEREAPGARRARGARPSADLSGAGKPGGTQRAQIHRGLRVAIVQKADQPSGALTEGVVQDILTSSPVHPRGIKVRLDSGLVGRVQRILSGGPGAPSR